MHRYTTENGPTAAAKIYVCFFLLPFLNLKYILFPRQT